MPLALDLARDQSGYGFSSSLEFSLFFPNSPRFFLPRLPVHLEECSSCESGEGRVAVIKTNGGRLDAVAIEDLFLFLLFFSVVLDASERKMNNVGEGTLLENGERNLPIFILKNTFFLESTKLNLESRRF